MPDHNRMVGEGHPDPPTPYGELGRSATAPRATFTVLPDVGHVPMIDDPHLVARTILTATGAEVQQR